MTADWRATLERENAKLRALLVRAKCDVVPPHLREDIDKALAEPQVNPSEASTLPELMGARSLMCTRLGVGLVREQVVEPFGFVMVSRDDARRAGLLAEGEESRKP